MNAQTRYELRVLSGLHRGASLPVDDQPQSIGGADDADVVLVDPGMAPRHAMLRLAAGGWSLLAVDGAVRGALHDAPDDQHDLAPGQPARVGHVWVTVVPHGAPWQDPPPEPPVGSAPSAQEPEPLHEASGPDDQSGLAPLGEGDDGLSPDDATDALAQIDGAVTADGARDNAAQQLAPGAPEKRRGARMTVPAGLGLALLAVATYAYSSRTTAPPAQALALDAPTPLTVKAAAPPIVSPDALRQALRQRLTEVDLLRRVDLQLDERAWTLRAALDDEEAARLRRILEAFVAAHRIDFPVNVHVGGADSMLPFRITQVISGSNASIVTGDGQRLYPGDDYLGVKLLAIDGDRLRFAGARPIEVKW